MAYYSLTFVILLALKSTSALGDVLCTVDPVSTYIDMCKDGCNKYIIQENNSQVLSFKDGSGSLRKCNMTLEAEPGLAIIINKGILFDPGVCGNPCNTGDFISFTDDTRTECICNDIAGQQLFASANSSVQIEYKGNIDFSLDVHTKGCSTRTLSLNPNKRNKLSTTLVRGDPTTDPSYVVRVQCRDGYMIKQNYTFIENECLITADSENWIGSWREEGVGCSKIKCSRPPDIENGDFSPYNIDDPYKEGDQISYRCDPGYEFTSLGYRNRTCLGIHGQGSVFEGFSPNCTKKSCGEPPVIQGEATLDGDGILFESTRTVKCVRGYQINGPSVLTCLASGSWSSAPVCEITRCVNQPNVANAKYDITSSPYSPTPGDNQIYGSKWNFTCNYGFKLVGDPLVTCREDGTWSPMPVCQADRCLLNLLPSSPGSACTDCDGNHDDAINTTRTYVCVEGYEKGQSSITCQIDGTWSSLPQCFKKATKNQTSEVIECGIPGNYSDTVLLSHNGTSLYDVSTYECLSGNNMNTVQSTCTESGVWSIPLCKKQLGSTQPAIGYMTYVYIALGVAISLVVLIVLTVGLCFHRSSKRRLSRTKINLLPEKSAKKNEGSSHCSNDSGLFVDAGELGDFENSPQTGLYDVKTGNLSMKPARLRYESSPTLPHDQTDLLSKPRSREPIGNNISLNTLGVNEEVSHPLYAEVKSNRSRSRNNSSPNSLLTNDFNHLNADGSNSSRYNTMSPMLNRNISHAEPVPQVKYSTNPTGLKVLTGKELKPGNSSSSLKPSPTEFMSTYTNKYGDQSVYY